MQAEKITAVHRFFLTENMARFDAELLRSLHAAGYGGSLQQLETLLGIDLMGVLLLALDTKRPRLESLVKED